MGVYEKSGHWYFEIMIRKKRYCRAIPEATCRKDAEKYVTVFKADLLRGRLDLAENIGQKPFIEIADMYINYAETNLSAKDTAVRIAKRFKELWKNKTIADITPKVIENYKESRQKTTFARKNPLREVNKLRVTNKLERHLSVEEEKRMYQVCDDDFSFSNLPREEQERLQRIHNGEHAYLKSILIMALNTGMRKGEILNMTWDCVDFDKNEISALNTKNGKKNTIPMSSKLRKTLLAMYQNKGQNKYVFTNPYTGTKYNDIKKCFKTVCKLANVKNLRFHDLRHTGATRMVAAGVPLPVVKQILNHASIQTTMRYAHTMREQEISAVEALANFN